MATSTNRVPLPNALGKGEIKFIDKTPRPQAIPPAVLGLDENPDLITGLVAVDIITDVPKLSVNIILAGVTVAHIILAKVTNWVLSGSQLIIYSQQSDTLILDFINSTESGLALVRFETCMNGGTV